jgi:hypothetical protein
VEIYLVCRQLGNYYLSTTDRIVYHKITSGQAVNRPECLLIQLPSLHMPQVNDLATDKQEFRPGPLNFTSGFRELWSVGRQTFPYPESVLFSLPDIK